VTALLMILNSQYIKMAPKLHKMLSPSVLQGYGSKDTISPTLGLPKNRPKIHFCKVFYAGNTSAYKKIQW